MKKKSLKTQLAEARIQCETSAREITQLRLELSETELLLAGARTRAEIAEMVLHQHANAETMKAFRDLHERRAMLLQQKRGRG